MVCAGIVPYMLYMGVQWEVPEQALVLEYICLKQYSLFQASRAPEERIKVPVVSRR